MNIILRSSLWRPRSHAHAQDSKWRRFRKWWLCATHQDGKVAASARNWYPRVVCGNGWTGAERIWVIWMETKVKVRVKYFFRSGWMCSLEKISYVHFFAKICRHWNDQNCYSQQLILCQSINFGHVLRSIAIPQYIYCEEYLKKNCCLPKLSLLFKLSWLLLNHLVNCCFHV